MRKLTVFDQQSLDGYFTSASGDVSWTHPDSDDRDFQEFSETSASGGNTLVFGRKTYEMMASFWPTPAGAKLQPVVAAQMNARAKLVFSRTLDKASWSNTTVVNGDLVTEVRRLKSEAGTDLTILGSGSLVGPLVQAGLVDELGIMLIPVVLGAGRTLFDGIGAKLKLTSSRAFKNGRVYLVYGPA